MRTKLMLEALAAWLALAATSGQACASVQSGATNGFGATPVLTMVADPIVNDRESSLDVDEITTPHSDGKVPAKDGFRANADVALLTWVAAARKGTPIRPPNGVHAPGRGPFRVGAQRSNAASDLSLSGADDLKPGRKNGYGWDLKRRTAFDRYEVVGAFQPQGVLMAANGGSALDAEKFYLIASPKLATGPTVPEPGNWATVLAGLLGVIAIARRRLSL